MFIKIICGNEDCRSEFSADTLDPFWECLECERNIENKYFPFLTARLMEAKSHTDTDWHSPFKEHFDMIKGFIEEKVSLLRSRDDSFVLPEKYSLDELEEIRSGGNINKDDFDLLIDKGHAVAIYLIEQMKTGSK